MDMLSIDQMDLDTTRFKDLKQRYPVDAGGFHGHRAHSAFLQPICQGVQILSKARKRLHRFRIAIGWYGDNDFRCANIDTASVGSHHRQTPLQLSMLSSLRLRHGSPSSFVGQRARRASLGNLSSGIIATQTADCASPMLLRTGLGSNSLTGSRKQAPMGKRPTLTAALLNVLKPVLDRTGLADNVKFLTVIGLAVGQLEILLEKEGWMRRVKRGAAGVVGS